MKKLLSFALVACAALFVSTGCGGAPQLEGLEKYSGVITLDGEPLADASINLIPSTMELKASGAVSDEKGRFVLQTLQAGDGVMPGDYRVTVIKTHMEDAYTPEEQKIFDEAGGKRHADVFPDRPEPTSVSDIPEYYGVADMSGLTLSLPEGGSKELKIELSSEE
ncbi:MAG: carboxypeptidase regulatory-like domain-containing protein [Thermoguttaceae bacterium]|nr:carboxypeptidase regulatory-like domain-containing protein [Thermoguttaceae bacterium]